jgi:hypothetical protein
MSATEHEMGILERRRIEAQIIKPIYEILVRDFGKEKAAAIIREAVGKAAVEAGRHFAAKEPHGADLRSFIALQTLWEQDDALKTVVHHADDAHYDYDVTRCRYAEMYRAMELGEIGYLLSCYRDDLFIQGYAPEVKLGRTQTIMEGASHCDFRYRLKEKGQK